MNRPGASEEPIVVIGSDEILAVEVRLVTRTKCMIGSLATMVPFVPSDNLD